MKMMIKKISELDKRTIVLARYNYGRLQVLCMYRKTDAGVRMLRWGWAVPDSEKPQKPHHSVDSVSLLVSAPFQF